MLPFFLYLLAGAITGAHLLLFAATGTPLNSLQLVSLAGSLCLIVAGYLSLFRPGAAAKLALLASLAMWCFYSPAIAKAVEARIHKKKAELSLTTSLSCGLLVIVPKIEASPGETMARECAPYTSFTFAPPAGPEPE